MARDRFVRPTYDYGGVETYLQITDEFIDGDDLIDIRIRSDGVVGCFSFDKRAREELIYLLQTVNTRPTPTDPYGWKEYCDKKIPS